MSKEIQESFEKLSQVMTDCNRRNYCDEAYTQLKTVVESELNNLSTFKDIQTKVLYLSDEDLEHCPRNIRQLLDRLVKVGVDNG
ncbi:hypothetical protein HYP05_gp040 [Salmonella phage ST-W77]|uniref:Uncharacterized protein n=6 Tax=Kuttervirus TaxID=2169536 RepID=A0A678PBF4_9CAUD|nr:hypothetical protein FF15_gp154 [Salmonella phage vB-SalM-SJ3]YP_009875949.1 hypothetical protein HYP05_gp040 [Salmonella phage ST-W77]YP_009887581.1 hypothetical protein HYQ30_gp056 [Salmonella phage heyday]YP_009890027.1 hypothetical protein HYP87_gp146 [Salmonella phage SE14]MDR5209333.1 hypothetical protein [Salmonella enterica subsp. enterica serovar Typhimurium]QQO39045.1 hypothetical protein [Salmonella phage SPHG3]WES09836.1 hypothetical protein [Salmonella phage SWJM-01]AHV82594.